MNCATHWYLAFVASFGLVGFGATAVVKQDTAPKKELNHMEHNEAMQACAKACSDCQRMCDMCATHCSHQLHEGKKEHITTLATCQDCSDFCAAASRMAARGGPFATLICESCAEACSRCAKACEAFPDDTHMKQCAEECRKCATACKEMTAKAGSHQHGK